MYEKHVLMRFRYVAIIRAIIAIKNIDFFVLIKASAQFLVGLFI